MMTTATEMRRRMMHIFEITDFVALYFVAFFKYSVEFLVNHWYLFVK